MRNAVLFVVATLALSSAYAQPKPSEILTRGGLAWADVFSDKAAAPVSALGMLGVSGDSIPTVENVRDLVVSLKGLSTSDRGTSFGLAITPARSALAPMDLSTYASGLGWRILGSTTLSYAQGGTSVQGAKFDRRAVAIETNLFLNDEDDPVLAVAKMYEQPGKGCPRLFESTPPKDPPKPIVIPSGATEDAAKKPAEAPEEVAKAVKARAAKCNDAARAALRWNRTQLSASLATGWIKASDTNADERTLGRALSLGGTYGFDHLGTLRDGFALSGVYRRTTKEPLLATLSSPTVRTKDTSLALIRLAGGTDKMRGLLEFSNAKSQDVTASQRAFKHAVGIDFRLYNDLWINLRVGRQYKIDGSRQETAGLLSISYSPTALLR